MPGAAGSDNDAGNGPHGGSAAILGFLHQLTASMARLVRAQFERVAGQADARTITAVLEPRPGGDLGLAGDCKHRIVQFKHRNRPLPVTDLTEGVFPDLYRSHCDASADAYELQATRGLSKPAAALVARCVSWAKTDPERRPALAGNGKFAETINRCRSIFERSGGDAAEFIENFAAFLARFEIGPILDAEAARNEVVCWLRTRVAYAEQAESSLDQLVGYLARKAKRNDARITVAELLAQLGLEGSDAAHPDEAVERLSSALKAALGERGFDSALDVREPITVSHIDPLTLVAGASGCGKSWTLYRLADQLNAQGLPVVLIRAATLADLQAQMRMLIAAKGLRQERPIEPALLGQLWRRMRDTPEAVVTVLWEGCRDVTALADLRLQGGLGEGLSLVAELPVVDDSAMREFARCPVHHVGEFTPLQLFQALEKRGISAGVIPQPIRQMLRLPVLCGIYATLAVELEDWNPLTEYRVLEDFWARAREHAGKFAGSRLKGLARLLIQHRQTFARDDQVADLGFNEAELEALVGAGWLSNLGERWSFAHDRLLTWTIAEALASDFASGSLESDMLAERVLALQGGEGTNNPSLAGLGFLLMDVVWLTSEDPARAGEVARFLRHFEPEQATGAHTLYGELLPTAGLRILPGLIERASLEVDPAEYVEPHLVAALRSLKLDEIARTKVLSDLWSADRGASRSVAISLGARWPLSAHRDELWKDYCALGADRETDTFDHELFTQLESALKCVAQTDPAWLEAQLATEAGQEELRLAAYLLKSLDARLGAPVWEATRARLFEIIPEDRHSVLIECIGRFGDHANLAILEAKITAGHRAGSTALDILADLNPGAALALIEQKPAIAHLPYGRRWLDCLLDLDFPRASAALRDWLLARDPSGRDLATVWRQVEERIDWATLAALLELLDAALANPNEAPRRTVASLLALLGSLTLDPVLDEQFSACRDSTLSRALFMRASDHFDGVNDEHYIPVRRLLRRIGGTEYEALILHALSPDDLDRARTGIVSSLFCPTPAVVARLEHLVIHGTSEAKGDESRIELWRALLALLPGRWRPRMTALLESDQAHEVKLGLFLIKEDAAEELQPAVLACLERSAAGSDVEALAMNLAATSGPSNPMMTDRALARLRNSQDENKGAALNVLLYDHTPTVRAALDAHLAPLATASSWKSYDADALAIRLSQGDANEVLWQAGERLMHRPSLFGRDFVESFVEQAPDRAMNVLLERAFAPPDVLTSSQPEAISTLARLDKRLATQAFMQAWTDHESRRQHLAATVRQLDDEALQVIVDHLHEDHQRGVGNLAFRSACVELRRAHKRARPMLLARLSMADADARIAISDAIAWMPDSPQLLAEIIANESDPDVRFHVNDTRREWLGAGAAIEQFRAHRTLETMEYVIDVADPAPLYHWDDPWRIIEDIQPDPRLTIFAERALARRLNEVQRSSIKNVRVRPRSTSAAS